MFVICMLFEVTEELALSNVGGYLRETYESISPRVLAQTEHPNGTTVDYSEVLVMEISIFSRFQLW
jgi:hypothetical protein